MHNKHYNDNSLQETFEYSFHRNARNMLILLYFYALGILLNDCVIYETVR